MRPSGSILGLLLGVSVLGLAAATVVNDFGVFLNPYGLLVVVGGTIASLWLAFSFSGLQRFVEAMFRSMSRPRQDLPVLSAELVRLAWGARSDPEFLEKKLPAIPERFCRDSFQRVVDGVPSEELRLGLRGSIQESFERDMSDASMFRSLSRFPPAFGLIGTILSLISHFQESPNQALSSAQLVNALSPTLYGMLLTYTLILPMAEGLARRARAMAKQKELVAHTVVMLQDNVPVVLVRERLKSFLSEKEQDAMERLLSDFTEQHRRERDLDIGRVA